MRMRKKDKPLALQRYDNGAWALFPPKGSIKKGPTPMLMSGPARMIEGQWERPNEDDYRLARQMWAHHQAVMKDA